MKTIVEHTNYNIATSALQVSYLQNINLQKYDDNISIAIPV